MMPNELQEFLNRLMQWAKEFGVERERLKLESDKRGSQ